MLWQALLCLLVPIAVALGDVVSDAVFETFPNFVVNGVAPRCEHLQDARKRQVHFTLAMAQPRNSTSGSAAEFLHRGFDAESLVTMVTMILNDRGLPATRSFVNILLINQRQSESLMGTQDTEGFLLSQNFKVSSPFLKVVGNAVPFLSLRTLQLNMLIPMTQMTFSTPIGTEAAQADVEWLPMGDYAVEIQIVRANSKRGGGMNNRPGQWKRWNVSVQQDATNVSPSNDIFGCLRLPAAFSLPAMTLAVNVTNARPFITNAYDIEWYQGSYGEVWKPFVAFETVYIVLTGTANISGQSWVLSDAFGFPNISTTTYALLSLIEVEGINGTFPPPQGCLLNDSSTVVLTVNAPRLASFLSPSLPDECGMAHYRLQYVFPDGRHTINTTFYVTGTPHESIATRQLASIFSDGGNVTYQLLMGIDLTLNLSRSTFSQYRNASSLVSQDRSSFESVMADAWNASIMQELSSLARFLPPREVSWHMQSTLWSAWNVLSQIQLPGHIAANLTTYTLLDELTDDSNDDAVETNSTRRILADAQAQRVPAALSVPSTTTSFCSLQSFRSIVQDLNVALSKIERTAAQVETSLSVLETLSSIVSAKSLSGLVRELVTGELLDVMPLTVKDAVLGLLIRLYVQYSVIAALVGALNDIVQRAVQMYQSGCQVSCFVNDDFVTVPPVVCDAPFTVPLFTSIEAFNVHPTGCFASLFPSEAQRINALVRGPSSLVATILDVLPAELVRVLRWDTTARQLRQFFSLPPRQLRAVSVTQILSVRSERGDPNLCRWVSGSDKGIQLVCDCTRVIGEDTSEPLVVLIAHRISPHADLIVRRYVRFPVEPLPSPTLSPTLRFRCCPIYIVVTSTGDDGGIYFKENREDGRSWPEVFLRVDQQYVLYSHLDGWRIASTSIPNWKRFTNYDDELFGSGAVVSTINPSTGNTYYGLSMASGYGMDVFFDPNDQR